MYFHQPIFKIQRLKEGGSRKYVQSVVNFNLVWVINTESERSVVFVISTAGEDQ